MVAEERRQKSLEPGIRAIIKFLFAEGNTEIKIKFHDCFFFHGWNVMSKKKVYQCCSMFETKRSGLDHEQDKDAQGDYVENRLFVKVPLPFFEL